MLCHPCNFALSKGFFRAQRKTVAGSLAIATWLIAISFFVFFYEATLRATLMAIQYQSPINTVQGKFSNINKNDSAKLFLESLDKEIPLIILSKSTFIKNNMAYATNPLYRQTWGLAEEKDLFYLPTVSFSYNMFNQFLN